MLERIIEFDTNLLIALNNLGSTTWDQLWMLITNKFSSIPVYLIVLFFLYKYYGLRKTIITLVFVALLITISDQTANLFKYGFERLRPCHNELVQNHIRLVKPSCGGYYSFFSAHASTSMAIAVFCSLLLTPFFKKIKYFLISWAVFVGYSRIYIGVHYPLDVAFGMLVGIAIAFTLFVLIKRVFNKI